MFETPKSHVAIGSITLCVCVCVCVCVRVRVRVCACVRAGGRARIYMGVCVYALRVCECVSVRACECVSVRACECVSVRAWVRVHSVCRSVCTCVYVWVSPMCECLPAFVTKST